VAAANRDDGLVALSDRLKGGAAENVARQLLKHGLAEEIEVAANAPFWRRRDDGVLIGLRITQEGLEAIGVENEDGGGEDIAEAETETGCDDEAGGAPAATIVTHVSAPRKGSRLALVVSLLGRPNGASIDELTAATGWLPHAVRAALTRLRQSGLAIERRAVAGGARYVISAKPDAISGRLDNPIASDPAKGEGGGHSNSEGPVQAGSSNEGETEDADDAEGGA
jgi:hypothetical protein